MPLYPSSLLAQIYRPSSCLSGEEKERRCLWSTHPAISLCLAGHLHLPSPCLERPGTLYQLQAAGQTLNEVSVRHESQGFLNWRDVLITTKECSRTHGNGLLLWAHMRAQERKEISTLCPSPVLSGDSHGSCESFHSTRITLRLGLCFLSVCS